MPAMLEHLKAIKKKKKPERNQKILSLMAKSIKKAKKLKNQISYLEKERYKRKATIKERTILRINL